MQLIHLNSVESTNKYCEVLHLNQVEDFTCYYADTQTAGIGQRGNHWESQPSANLTFSLILHPHFLHPSRQFALTQTLALALHDTLTQLLPSHTVHIKWPNDIYVDLHKISGTLIQTYTNHSQITSAICGIGLNINQTSFPSWIPNPTSLALLTGHHHPLLPLLQTLLQAIHQRYLQLQNGTDPTPDYLAHLLNFGQQARYRYHETEIQATITTVDQQGRLHLTTTSGQPLVCSIKEITLLSSTTP
ncbi:MAG: biotin--[Bacteroidales bacterium]|nr:biotin--[acetyl-CoA-carboxylase] ligase [Bacteroidales bacterium]